MKDRKRTSLGFTLMEVMITIAIIALISGGIALAVIDHFRTAKIKNAHTDAAALRNGVKTSWIEHASAACPTVTELIENGTLDENSRRTDPWGGPWQISCDGTKVAVSSSGPDGEAGTPDDIRVPKP
jgi:prepilin-type N-terminal cleavage/methylation domain-containing protein